MKHLWILGAAALLLLAGAPAHAQRGTPDPRTPALRRALALAPHARRAIWIDLDPHAAASTLPPALSRDAIARRVRTGVGILPNDRPIAPGLVRRLVRAGARIRVLDRWSRSVSADVDSATASRIARLRFVTRMEPVLRLVVTGLERTPGGGTPPPAAQQDTIYGVLFPALQQLDIPAAHALGYTGTGVRIGMLDSGFDRSHETLQSMRVLAQYDFIWGDTVLLNQPRDTFNQASHGTATASVLGGNKRGTLVGAAYNATFLLAKTEVDNPLVDSHQDEDRWVQGALWMDSVGVDIISSSLGYRYDFPDSAVPAPMYPQGNGLWAYTCAAMNGRTTRTSLAASQLGRRHILLVTAMGNDGDTKIDPTTHSSACTINAPADADSVLAVGAVDSAGVVASFSSRGPTGDGRTKPELSALGERVPHAVAGTLNGYGVDGGTSFSTPLIAGAAALVLQAWPNFSPMAIRQALLLSAPKPAPDNAVGVGVPDVASAIMFPQGLDISDVTPRDPLGVVGSIAPTFTWLAPSVSLQARPIRYRVDVATDSAFTNVVYSDTALDRFQLTARVPLRPMSAFWWRLTANVGSSITRRTRSLGAYSLPHWLRIKSISGQLVSTHTTFVPSPRPTFVWSSLAAPAPVGPLTFRLQIKNSAGNILFSDTTRADSLALRQSLDYNAQYTWRVIAQAHDTSGAVVADTIEAPGNFVISSDESPPSTTLYQNFPNPFPISQPEIVTTTHIWFDLRTNGPVELAIYDLHGRLVRRLIPAAGCPAQTFGPGTFGRLAGSDPCRQTTWDGTDDQGHQMPRGVYLLRLRADGTSQTRHIVYVPPS